MNKQLTWEGRRRLAFGLGVWYGLTVLHAAFSMIGGVVSLYRFNALSTLADPGFWFSANWLYQDILRIFGYALLTGSLLNTRKDVTLAVGAGLLALCEVTFLWSSAASVLMMLVYLLAALIVAFRSIDGLRPYSAWVYLVWFIPAPVRLVYGIVRRIVNLQDTVMQYAQAFGIFLLYDLIWLGSVAAMMMLLYWVTRGREIDT